MSPISPKPSRTKPLTSPPSTEKSSTAMNAMSSQFMSRPLHGNAAPLRRPRIDRRLENLDRGAVLPRVGGKARLAARFGEEPERRPAMLHGHLRQEQAAPPVAGDEDSVP